MYRMLQFFNVLRVGTQKETGATSRFDSHFTAYKQDRAKVGVAQRGGERNSERFYTDIVFSHSFCGKQL